jgi:hypothetical protein
MDASSTRSARSVALSLRSRSAPVRASAATEVAPTRAVSPSSALDGSQNDLDRRPSGGEREATLPLTDPIGRTLLDVLGHEEAPQPAVTPSTLLRARAYARQETSTIAKPTAEG